MLWSVQRKLLYGYHGECYVVAAGGGGGRGGSGLNSKSPFDS